MTALPPLHAIVDADVSVRAGWRPSELARACLDGGATCIQLRAKSLPSDRFLALCDDVVGAAARYGAHVIVNDRADLARMSGATGVHVGQDDLPPEAVRALVEADAIVGYSTHSVGQIEEAARQSVSYIAVGPVFGTTTKDTGYAAVGLDLVQAAVARATGRPVVAIGGITLENAPAVLAAGASGVAVISDLLTGGDPVARTAAFIRVLEDALGRGR